VISEQGYVHCALPNFYRLAQFAYVYLKGTMRIPGVLQKDTPASTNIFGGFGSFYFTLVVAKFEKCPK